MKMLVVLTIAALALAFIVRDLVRSADARPIRSWSTWLRAAPFIVFGALSIWIAFRAPQGRRAFSFDLSVVPADLARSMTKVPHLIGSAVLFWLAALAFGPRHLGRAFVATMLLGVSWELGESTVVGHFARVADLAPDLVGATVALALVAATRLAIDRQSTR